MSEVARQEITLEFAEEALREIILMRKIDDAVRSVFDLEPYKLQSDESRDMRQLRMLAMWMARKLTRAASTEIGDFFGHRSRSTVIKAEKEINNLISQDGPISLLGQTWAINDAVREVERRLA